MQLQRGEKRALSDLGIGTQCAVKVEFGMDGADIAAFGLNKDRKIGDDRYVVLFSNTRTPEGAITLAPSSGAALFNLELDKLPSSIDRVVFTATHDTRPVGESRPLLVTVGNAQATFNVAEHLNAEKAAMLIEIYRHSSGWRLGTIAAGFEGGLASLIAHFGGEVADAPAPAPAAAPAPIPVAQTAPAASPAPAAAASVSLKKVTLEKGNSRVSLQKTGGSFGEIVLNLNWSQLEQKRGLFGGGTKTLDLDLGVMFELQDGYKGCIQGLGRSFGDYEREPYIQLSGDDRTGAVTSGETIRVNGRHFDKIKRIGVFALIYEGAPNWQQTDGVVRMTVPGQPEIEIRLVEGRDNARLCGIALLNNVNGNLQVDRHMQYYRDQKQFADDIGIFLQWTAGRKD
ncbi:TerD family protein [Asticcacaulis sp. AC402]|uniref:TerD family protein n=1 Tax=Asticcacaulis sp. AC402 TaxID=1282361 RepID=UPI0003C3C093|nr:TerD family protein [Asticcacaulis sp. AC402]ESQ73964.1 Tellurium resistance [Asticcacaulis sp. AC402]